VPSKIQTNKEKPTNRADLMAEFKRRKLGILESAKHSSTTSIEREEKKSMTKNK
jgi:hypothetical protein